MESDFFNVSGNDGVIVLHLRGDVSNFAIDEILADVKQTVEAPNPQAAVIDFADAEFFGSTLLEGLRALWTHIHAKEGKMALCNLHGTGKDVIEVSHLNTLWPMFATRDEALEFVQS